MKRYLLIILLIINAAATRAQSDYNSNEYWARFALQPHNLEPLKHSDTCLVFVTNRHIHPQSPRFVDEFLDTASLKYFFLEKIDGQWNVYQESTLREAMEHLPQRKDIVVYAEGMGKIFTSNVERAQLMSGQYNVNVIMFDYASINSTYKPSKNFRFARTNARLSAGQYLSLLRELKEAKERGEAWISGVKLTTFYHSMGNIILEQMMLHRQIGDINDTPFVDNLVINAACVPSKHHAEWVGKIRFAKQVYVHYNRHDLQLKGAHLLTFRKQLGEKSNKKKRAENAVYVGFHDMVGRQHSYFMNFPYNDFKLSPAMVAYFSRLFNGKGISRNEATALLATQQPGNVRM